MRKAMGGKRGRVEGGKWGGLWWVEGRVLGGENGDG